MKKRLLASLLSLAMVLTLLPVSALAAGEGDTPQEPTSTTEDAIAEIKVGGQTTKYTSAEAFRTAVADLNGEATVKLLSNVALTEGSSTNKKLTFPAGRNVTLNLNGKALTVGYRIEVKGNLTVQGGGTIVSAAAYLTAPYAVFYLYSSGTLALNNVTVNAKEEDGSTGFVLYVPAATNASVSGGVLNGQIDANAGTLSITGGKFTADISPYLEAGQSAANDTDGYYSISNTTLNADDAAAQIGTGDTAAYYATVVGALAAAKNNDTITVLKGTTEITGITCSGTNVTLDLNGKTVDMGSKKITVSGGLTIKDGVGSGKLTGSTEVITVNQNASLTLESGTVEATGSTAIKLAYSSGISFTMHGGTVKGAGKTVDALRGTVTITGGRVETSSTKTYEYAVQNSYGEATITIGTADGGKDDVYITSVQGDKDAELTIHSGTVGKIGGAINTTDTINGYIEQDFSAILPAGKICESYTYGGKTYYRIADLTEENAQAKIGDTLYASAATAAEALKDDETLTLLKDITGEGAGDDGLLEIEARNVIIDLNGHSVTNNADDGVGISVKNPNKSPLADCTATIKNDGAPAKITAKVPVRFSSGNSMYKITGKLQGDITLITTDTSENAQQIELSAGALLAYSEAAADALGNGGFKATNANGDQYIYATASEAIAADAYSTAFLLNDYIGGTSLQLNGDTGTVDLGGHTYVYTNTIAAIVADESNTNLTVKNGTVISGENAVDGVHVGVPAESSSGQVIRNDVSLTLDNVKMTVSAGTFGIVTNGNSESVSVTLKNGSILTAPGTIGIYFPVTSGTLTIENSSITAGTGVAVKGGTVNISGDSVIHATGAKFAPAEALGSGVNSTGDAVYLEGNYERETTINITGGTFTSDNGYAVQMLFADNTEDKTISISGGSFSSDPSAYVTEKYIALVENGQYVVQEKSDDTEPATVVGGAPETTVSGVPDTQKEAVKAAVNQIQAEGLTGEANAEASTNTVTADDGAKAINADEGITGSDVEASDVTIVVQPYLEIEVTGYKTGEDADTPNTMTLDITPMVRTVATTADLDTNEGIYLETEGENQKNAVVMETGKKLDVSTPITLTIPLPANFVTGTDTPVYVQHKGYEYTANVTESGEESNKTYTATFTNPHGFSTFTISTESQTVATLNGVSYTSLQDALADAEDGDTVKVLKNGLNASMSGSSRTITLENGTSSAITVTINGETKNIATGGTEEFTYTRPSSGGGSSTPTYTVSKPSDVTGGEISVSPSRAAKNATVTITVKPDEGYELDELIVRDSDGETVKLTQKSDTEYTFKMPASKVTVEASFVEIEPVPSELPFTDVAADAWYHDAVAYVYDNGMMNGVTENTFAPNATTTRGMIVTMLHRLEGKPGVNYLLPFGDVPEGLWYTEAVRWAASEGIVNGVSDTSYAPDNAITREQMAAILYRYAQYKGYDTSVGGMSLAEYTDADQISSYATTAMQWANENGLITGRTDTTLIPQGTATRAEVATILMRFCEDIAK